MYQKFTDYQVDPEQPLNHDSIIQKSTVTTDIYGDRLLDRLHDIYSCIHFGAEEMVSEMVNLPGVSEQGLMEIEIIMAAILSYRVEKGIVLQSLLAEKPAFHKVGLTNITKAMEGYLNEYRSVILEDDIKRRSTLLDFVKDHVKLKLATLIEHDEYGNKKAPIFVDNNANVTHCRFVLFDENEQNADFIIENKSSIIIDETKKGEYLFRHQRDLDWSFEYFMRLIAFYVYCSPLNYRHVLCGGEIEEGLAGIKRRATNVSVISDINNEIPKSDFEETSNICPDIHYALMEGVNCMVALAISTGLIESGLRG